VLLSPPEVVLKTDTEADVVEAECEGVANDEMVEDKTGGVAASYLENYVRWMICSDQYVSRVLHIIKKCKSMVIKHKSVSTVRQGSIGVHKDIVQITIVANGVVWKRSGIYIVQRKCEIRRCEETRYVAGSHYTICVDRCALGTGWAWSFFVVEI
jgi:hypothetical protein